MVLFGGHRSSDATVASRTNEKVPGKWGEVVAEFSTIRWTRPTPLHLRRIRDCLLSQCLVELRGAE